MKKFLLSLAAVALATTAFAQNGAPLYIVGDVPAGWAPDAPDQFTYADGVYTFEGTAMSMVKVSTAMGDWDTFNAAAIGLSTDPEGPGTYNLEPWGENINMPWEGDWKLVVAGDLTTLTLSTTTPPPTEPVKIYAVGNMTSWSFDDPAFEMHSDDQVVYTLVTDLIPEVQTDGFKFAKPGWAKYNFGGASDGMILYVDGEPAEVANFGDAKNLNMDWEGHEAEPIKYVLDVKACTVTLTWNTGIESIENAAEAAAPVYYNLQGVRVENPANGLYIRVAGSKTSKVIL